MGDLVSRRYPRPAGTRLRPVLEDPAKRLRSLWDGTGFIQYRHAHVRRIRAAQLMDFRLGK